VETTLTPGSTAVNTKATFASEADANVGKVYFDKLAASGAAGVEGALSIPITQVGAVSDVVASNDLPPPPVDVSPPLPLTVATPSPPPSDEGGSLLVPFLVPLLFVCLLAVLILFGAIYYMKNKKGKLGVKSDVPTKKADEVKFADAPSTSYVLRRGRTRRVDRLSASQSHPEYAASVVPYKMCDSQQG
jgi:hypothetical protein